MACHPARLGMLATPERAGRESSMEGSLEASQGKPWVSPKYPDDFWGDTSWINLGDREAGNSILLTVQILDVTGTEKTLFWVPNSFCPEVSSNSASHPGVVLPPLGGIWKYKGGILALYHAVGTGARD